MAVFADLLEVVVIGFVLLDLTPLLRGLIVGSQVLIYDPCMLAFSPTHVSIAKRRV